jgi:hypothetical protein
MPAFQSNVDWFNLLPNTTYYSRVATWIGVWVHSDPIAFHTPACSGFFSAPTSLTSTDLSATSVRVRWDEGTNNSFFCVDTAHTLDDLFGFSGTWQNHNCGTTAEVADLHGLDCNSSYFWRVWAAGPTTGHSGHATFDLGACTFTVPNDLTAEALSSTSITFSWDPGLDNDEYCVDTARNLEDLLAFEDTWDNHGCWAASPPIIATDLRCDTNYFWRVFARGDTGEGHSAVSQKRTDDC